MPLHLCSPRRMKTLGREGWGGTQQCFSRRGKLEGKPAWISYMSTIIDPTNFMGPYPSLHRHDGPFHDCWSTPFILELPILPSSSSIKFSCCISPSRRLQTAWAHPVPQPKIPSATMVKFTVNWACERSKTVKANGFLHGLTSCAARSFRHHLLPSPQNHKTHMQNIPNF